MFGGGGGGLGGWVGWRGGGQGFREFGGVVVHWLNYGGAGHRALPQGLVIENYPLRAEEAHTHTPSVLRACTCTTLTLSL